MDQQLELKSMGNSKYGDEDSDAKDMHENEGQNEEGDFRRMLEVMDDDKGRSSTLGNESFKPFQLIKQFYKTLHPLMNLWNTKDTLAQPFHCRWTIFWVVVFAQILVICAFFDHF
jgi:hypothetical protein